MLLAIALQESKFLERKQIKGPARGFWQFEAPTVKLVAQHKDLAPILVPVLHTLRYSSDPKELYTAIENNDTLAAVFARLLLWNSPRELPALGDFASGWRIYIEQWRPGKEKPDTWQECYDTAWKTILHSEEQL
jgi:hypothetical protein